MGLIEKKKIALRIFWRRFRGSSRSVICAPTGTEWHSAAALGFENDAGKQRALWIYGKSLPCILRRLQIPFCEDTTEVLAGGTQVWNAKGKQREGVKRHYRHWSLNLRSETGEIIPGSPMQTFPSLDLREGENAGSMGENVILKFISLWHCLRDVCALSLSPPPLHRPHSAYGITMSLWTPGGRLYASTAALHAHSSSTRTSLPPTTGQYQLQTRTPREEKKQDGISTCSAVLFSENPNQNLVQRKTGKAGLCHRSKTQRWLSLVQNTIISYPSYFKVKMHWKYNNW